MTKEDERNGVQPETTEVIGEMSEITDVEKALGSETAETVGIGEAARLEMMRVGEFLGREWLCHKCNKPIEFVGDIRIPRYDEEPKPDDAIYPFMRSLYMRYHEDCVSEVEEAVNLVGGDVVGELQAREDARKLFLDLVANGGPVLKEGCIFCGKKDPGEKADDWARNRVLRGFPTDLWVQDGIPNLKGKEICAFCNRNARIAGVYAIPLDDYRTLRIKQLAEEHNGYHGRSNHNGRAS